MIALHLNGYWRSRGCLTEALPQPVTTISCTFTYVGRPVRLA
jgi:hypothetical protein